jgi:hypothetical protein
LVLVRSALVHSQELAFGYSVLMHIPALVHSQELEFGYSAVIGIPDSTRPRGEGLSHLLPHSHRIHMAEKALEVKTLAPQSVEMVKAHQHVEEALARTADPLSH